MSSLEVLGEERGWRGSPCTAPGNATSSGGLLELWLGFQGF